MWTFHTCSSSGCCGRGWRGAGERRWTKAGCSRWPRACRRGRTSWLGKCWEWRAVSRRLRTCRRRGDWGCVRWACSGRSWGSPCSGGRSGGGGCACRLGCRWRRTGRLWIGWRPSWTRTSIRTRWRRGSSRLWCLYLSSLEWGWVIAERNKSIIIYCINLKFLFWSITLPSVLLNLKTAITVFFRLQGHFFKIVNYKLS